MAKKRAKKVTRAASKAKRSTARRGQRLLVDSGTGQAWMFDPKTGEPAPGSVVERQLVRLSPAERARLAKRAHEENLRRDEFRARRRARLTSRGSLLPESLPSELERWLLSLRDPAGEASEVLRWHDVELGAAAREVLEQWARDWYLEGCRQGYVEGRLVEIATRQDSSVRKVKRERNRVVTVEGVPMSKDERDAEIFASWPELKREHGAEVAERILEQRYGVGDRRVRQIVLEQSVLREWAGLVQQGFGEALAAERVVQKHGVDQHGKPSPKRQEKIRKILAKAPLRTLPEVL